MASSSAVEDRAVAVTALEISVDVRNPNIVASTDHLSDAETKPLNLAFFFLT